MWGLHCSCQLQHPYIRIKREDRPCTCARAPHRHRHTHIHKYINTHRSFSSSDSSLISDGSAMLSRSSASLTCWKHAANLCSRSLSSSSSVLDPGAAAELSGSCSPSSSLLSGVITLPTHGRHSSTGAAMELEKPPRGLQRDEPGDRPQHPRTPCQQHRTGCTEPGLPIFSRRTVNAS